MGAIYDRNALGNVPLHFEPPVRQVGGIAGIKEVIALAQKNGGVITTHEALALGVARSTLQRRVNDGVFVRVGRGVLALPGTSTRSDIAIRAALKSLNGVVSHESAATMHHFEPRAKSRPTITVSHRSTHSFAGVVVHQSTDLLESHVMTVDGMRVTTAARTLVDLARYVGRRRLERLVEHALVSGKVDIEELADLVTALSRKGKKGLRQLRDVVDQLQGSAVADSELERQLFQMIDRAGLPRPNKQFHAPWLQARNGRVDFAYLDERIVVEADSRRWHLSFDAFETDRARDNAAQLAGWMVLRFTWRMMRDDQSGVIDMIRRALADRSE
ncbi:MAG: type IV toxin-antitoxin system AbiEi family antitoxin domain-containing protein [Acidimicrobiia bacterium]